MAQPVWITPAGPLEGPIPEGIFFKKSLLASTDIAISNLTSNATRVTNLTANGSQVTVTFAEQRIAPYSVGQTVEIAEVTPTTYNGTYTVVSCTTTTLQYASTVTDTWTGGGVIVDNATRVTVTFAEQRIAPYSVGQTVEIAEVTPTTYNGTYTVLSCTTTSLQYASTVTDTYVNGGGVIIDPNDSVFFELIAGTLPDGIQIAQSGLITGTPVASIKVQGVPQEVSRDVTSQFAIRAYTVRNNVVSRLADRTFTLTITGQNQPEFTTPAGLIAQYFGGTVVTGLQIGYSDPDPDDVVVMRLRAGSLPPGLTLSSKGVISGFVQPNAIIDKTAGFSRDEQGYDQFPFDFVTRNANVNFEFVVELSDGKSSSLRAFSIFVWSRSDLTADTTFLTADNTFITADGSPITPPVMTTPQGSIGTVRNDNFFAFQFTAVDVDGEAFKYTAVGDLPPGLSLDPDTGWLSGYIPDLGIIEIVYDITVRVYKTANPTIISDAYVYSLTITGPISSQIRWLTPSDPVAQAEAEITGVANLGTIVNGSTSLFYVQAVNLGGLELQYRLLSGSASSLPQGLQLLDDGTIAGRVSFDTFALDSGTTTFDISKENGSDPTTFDMTFVFTVNAYSINGVVSVNKVFSIIVERVFDEPYDNLYIQCMPPQSDRDLIASLLQNSDIFEPSLIYRSEDPNFGVARNVTYRHAYGLTSATLADYYSSLYLNHYWKNLILGDIKTAQARDAAGNVIYEVVYSQVIDNLENDQGQSVSKAVALPYAVTLDDSTQLNVVYPNSLTNMRDQVIDTVGQISQQLPLWMTSKQADGSILGFTPAWVLAYTKPECADRIVYYINTQFGQRLNVIDFKVDRYELDRLLSKNWDSATGEWIPTPPTLTTFDITGVIASWVNLANITVYWENDNSTNFISSWTTATPPGTTFDGGSMQFVDPVDMYTNTQAYDKYLVFPKVNILE